MELTEAEQNLMDFVTALVSEERKELCRKVVESNIKLIRAEHERKEIDRKRQDVYDKGV
jgi:hypothetical protein